MATDMGTIGQFVVVKGELRAEEDLTVDGKVDGKIEADRSVLTIGPNGRVKGELKAQKIIVMGKVNGNVTATEKIILRGTSVVHGDLVAPSVGIAEGARLQGRVEVQGLQAAKAPAASKALPEKKPQITKVAGAAS